MFYLNVVLGFTKSVADFGCGKNLISGRNVTLAPVAFALGGGDLMEREIFGVLLLHIKSSIFLFLCVLLVVTLLCEILWTCSGVAV